MKISTRFSIKISEHNNVLKKRLAVFSLMFLCSLYSFAQLHSTVSCNNSIASGTLVWETAPTNSSEFDWTPDGALTNTFNNISGSGVNTTITFTGDTGTLEGWNGTGGDTPEIDTNNGTESLQFFTPGFNASGITITITFSQPVNAIGFDLAHINGSGPNGDSYTITASEVGGGTLFPTFTESANPSYTTNTSGFVNSNNNSTAGDNDEVGVNFSSSNGINSITLVWDECTTCTAGTAHGSAIQDISFCVNGLPTDDCPTITSEGIFDPYSDVLITSYHQSMAKTTTGFVAWGEDMDSDGSDATTITEITPANGYNYAGTPTHFTVSGNSNGQAFLATTTSLYVWGGLGEVVDNSFATNGAFNDMNSTQTLPFTAANITQLHASSDVLFVLSSGQIWVATTGTTAPNGNASGNANIWQQVQTSAGVPLTGVINVTGNKYAGYAQLSNGDIYTWGDNVVLGNGSGIQDLDYATLMTALPVSVTYISSYTHNDNDTGLLALGADKKIYGIGDNTIGEIITTGTGVVTSWTAIQASGGGDFVGAIQISTSHTSEEWAGASVITAGATPSDPNILYTWGINNNNSLGHGGDGVIQNPTIPPSFTVGTDDPVSASVGGHATTFFNRANGGSICFVGHIIQGSTGGLTTGDGSSFECVIPATLELCGTNNSTPPTAVDDAIIGATTGSPATVDTIDNDSDPDGTIDGTTVDLDPTNSPTGSSCTATDAEGDCIEVTVPNEGVWTVDQTTGDVTFTPEVGFTSDPSPIEYTVDDNDGNTSNIAEISIDYDAQDPIAVDDAISGATTGSPATVDTIDNDSDPDGTIDGTTVDLDPTNSPTGSSCTATDAEGDCIEVTVPNEGVWTVDQTTGDVTFTPEVGFTSDPSPIEYTVDDNDGNTSNIAEISIDYDAQDPIAVDDAISGATTGSPATVDTIDNDSDPDGTIDGTTVDLDPTNSPTGSSCTATDAEGDCIEVTVPNEGVWTVDQTTGDVTFTPEVGFTSDPSPIEYTVDDNDGNTSNIAEISIDYDAQDPIAVDDAISGATTGSPATVDTIDNDSDPDGTIDGTTVDLDPTNSPTGSSCTATDAEGDCIEVTVPNEGVWTVDQTTGDVTFTPEVGFTSDPSPIEYTVDDNDGNTSNIAEISIDYDAQDPIAVDDAISGATTGSPATVDTIDNDSDPDGTIDGTTVDLDPTNSPTGSSCTATDAEGDCIEVTVPNEGVWTVDQTTGDVTFTPEVGFTSDPSPIEYTVDDNDGNTSNIAEISIDYDAQDPIAVDDAISGATTGSPATVDTIDNDSDPDGTIDGTTVDLDPTNSPTGSSCTATDAEGDCIEVTVPNEGVWTVDQTTGDVTFTPEVGFTSDPSPIEYTVDDNDGNTSNIAEISIDYDAQDPIAVDDAISGATTGSPATVDTIDNDSDPDGTIDGTTVDLDPTNSPTGSSCTATDAEGDCIEVTVPNEGVWTVDQTTGDVTFTPEVGFTSDPSPIEYTVDDNDGNTSNIAEISIDYDAQDPIAVDDAISGATTGSPATVDTIDNDSDPDGTIDGTTVDLDPTNSPTGSSCTATDAEGDCIEVTVPNEGVWTVDQTTGDVTFTPEVGFTSDPSPIEYTVDDNDGNTSNIAEISIDYDAQDPIAVDDAISGATTGSPATVDTIDNDSDPDGTIDGTTVDLDPTNSPTGSSCTATDAEGDCIEVTVPNEGVWTVDQTTGDVTFTPEVGFTSDPSPIEYTVDDNDGNTSNIAEISIDYDAQDPIAVDDAISGATTGSPATVDTIDNDSDPDGTIDGTTVDLDPTNSPTGSSCTATDAEGDCIEVTVPNEGVWTVDQTTGDVTFTPEVGFTSDPSPIEYTVDDNDGNTSNIAEISIDYDAQDPIAVDDAISGATTGSPATVDTIDNDSDPDGTIDGTTVDLDPTNSPTGSSCTATDAEGDCIEVTVPNEGVWTVDQTTGDVTFTPEVGFTSDPSPIEYTVDDNDGNTSNIAEISIDYDAQDPIAVDDAISGATTGSPATVDTIDNDSDPDGTIDGTTVDLDPTNSPTGSSCTATDAEGDCIEVTVPNEGVWTVDQTTGDVTFTPEVGFTSDPSPIEYTVDDNDGNTSNIAEISIDYDPCNGLGTADCDGDGTDNGNDPDPLDPCTDDGTIGDEDLSNPIFADADCDGDGVTNGDEIDPDGDGTPGPDGTDWNDPCDYDPADVTLTQGGAWDTADCDGDGTDNGNDPDPLDPCTDDGTIGDEDLSNPIFADADCDGDGVTNGDEIDPDGDGTPGPDGTDWNDPCDYDPADVTLAQGGAWDTADCDGDGTDNGNDPDPLDPCTDDGTVGDEDLSNPIFADADCDGDGVTNGDEIDPDGDGTPGPDGTDWNDPCDYDPADVTLTQGGAWDTADCDGDGTDNGNDPDPLDPCTDDGTIGDEDLSNPIFADADCDGDGVTNGDEIDPDGDGTPGPDGTDWNDPCDYDPADVTLAQGGAWDTADCDGDGTDNGNDPDPLDPCTDDGTVGDEDLSNPIFADADCDGDGVTNGDEIDPDGDGTPGPDGTDWNDPCDYDPADVTLAQGGAWDTADCDGDGTDNGNDPDPLDPCTDDGTVGDEDLSNPIFADADCDGDGVTNGDEIDPDGDGTPGPDGTDWNDPCDYDPADVTLTQGGAWDTADCDGDGTDNGNDPDPLDPCTDDGTIGDEDLSNPIFADADCDGDGVTNGDEIDPDGDGTPGPDGTDWNDPCDYDPADVTLAQGGAWDTADCDGDGTDNGNDPDPLDPCTDDGTVGDEDLSNPIFADADCDGDGVTNGDEIDPDGDGTPGPDGTDWNDPCDYDPADVTLAQGGAWDTADCDGDGTDNGNDPDPLDPCTDDGTIGDEDLSNPIFADADCDGDGVTNGDEIDPDGDGTPGPDGTDWNDPCDYDPADVTLAQGGAWDTADCDGDGTDNGNDPDPLDPCTDDGTIGDEDLSNPIFADADCDGDGVTNGDEIDPDGDGTPGPDGTDWNDPCDYDPADVTLTQGGAWDTADCDGDGTDNGNDPDPLDPCTDDGTVGDEDLSNPIFADADCDGDGVTNGDEIDPDGDGTPGPDGTDWNDPCDYDPADVTLTQGGAWDTADCDGDGTDNGNDPDPLDPCTDDGTIGDEDLSNPIFADADCDGDGVTNGDEIDPDGDGTPGPDGTDWNDPCDYDPADVTLAQGGAWDTADCDGDGTDNGNDPDPLDPCTDDGTVGDEDLSNPIFADADCDGDGVTNGDEIDPDGDGTPGPDGTDWNDPCDYEVLDITLPITSGADCDGDGVIDADEISDGTDPTDPCDFEIDSISVPPSSTWNDLDCDFDNVPNGEEIGYGDTDGDGDPNFNDPDDDNDGVDTINEDYTDTDLSDNDVDPTGDGDPTNDDTDGDGVPDYLDTDDDGDDILTIDEYPDPDGDGIGFGGDAFDSNGNGLPDYLEFNDFDLSDVEDEIEVYNVITPNGDNDNDVFTIRNIELFPNNQVRIYNRWGVMVYETEGYGQDGKYFEGESDGRVNIQQKELLPVGTYFYIINYVNGDGVSKDRAGYLYIQR